MTRCAGSVNLLRKKLKRAREALRWVKRDCEICDWHCHGCGTDLGAKELDLYSEVKKALKETA